MAKRRRRNSSKQQKVKSLPKAAKIVAFTEEEEAFFRAGMAQDEAHASGAHMAAESFDDLEPMTGNERPSFWRRLFARAPQLA